MNVEPDTQLGGGGGGSGGGGGGGGGGGKKNIETTLTHLTKRFVKLTLSNSERAVNLNEAALRLSVPKRRIYDITNVLEGIGLLKKTSKNLTKWIDCPPDSPFAAPSASSDAELLDLLKTLQTLEEGVIDLESNIRQQLSAQGAFVTYNDIKSFFNDQIVIAVKAPPETRLEVNENLQIWMKSENGEIEVYLCPQYSNNNTTTTQNTSTPQQLQPQHNQSNPIPHLQPSQLGNSFNTILDETVTNLNSQPHQSQASSDEGRGKSVDGQYYDTTLSGDDHYYNDPTLTSAISGTISEDEDFKSLVPFGAREEPQYNFMLDDNYSITSLFPEDNLGLY